MNILGKYSNGWGHLIVTIASLIFCFVLLLVSQDSTIKSLAVSVVTLLIGYWFGGARRAAEEHKGKEDGGS